MFVLDIIGIQNENYPHIHGVNLKYECNVGCSCDNTGSIRFVWREKTTSQAATRVATIK